MRRLLTAYLAAHGPVALLAEALAMAAVFGVIGAAFAFPAASGSTPDPAHSPRAEEAGRGMGSGG